MTRTLWLIVALAAALRFYGLWFGIPYPNARPDESVALGYAVAMLDGDLNPHFFHWPSLIFYLFAALHLFARAIKRSVAGGAGLTGPEYLLIARGFVALAGTLTVVVLFRLARRTSDTTTALLAAGFLAVSLLHVRESHFAMTDAVMTLLAMLSLALLLRGLDETARTGVVRAFALAGLTGGLAASTKYSAAAVVVSAVAAQLVLVVRARQRLLAVGTWIPAVVFGAAFALGFFGGSPYALLDYPSFLHDLRYDMTHLASVHGVDVGRGWSYHLRRSLPFGMGIGLFVAGLAGFAPLLRRHGAHGVVIAAFAAAFYAVIGSGQTVFFRYVLPLVPVLCLTAAIAARTAAAWLASRTRLTDRRALALIVLLLAGPAAVNAVWFVALLGRTDTRVLAARWLAPRVQPEDTLYDSGNEYARLDLGQTGFRRWLFDPGSRSFGHPEGRTPDWLVIPISPLRAYATAPDGLRELATSRYELVWIERATTTTSARLIYDEQDAFFMPVAGFRAVRRPGPTILIYRLVRRE